jgi:alkylation response protein AidB-like acyl-CoA dehydrogenase
MIRDMCDQFLDAEVYPILDRIDNLEPGLMKIIAYKSRRAGFACYIFSGRIWRTGKDFVTSTIVNEYLGAGHSFSVAIAAHTGIGTLPILYFGTEQQKQKYIPKLISGEWAGAYGLTEPNSGSDALGAKTSAKLESMMESITY